MVSLKLMCYHMGGCWLRKKANLNKCTQAIALVPQNCIYNNGKGSVFGKEHEHASDNKFPDIAESNKNNQQHFWGSL
jgi:hypothetical protein